MSNEWSPNTVFDVVADERVRQILVATNQQPRSAQDLVDVCDGSISSIYRRIDVLVNYDLLTEKTKIDPDGHHYNIYVLSFDNMTIAVEDQQIVVEVNGSQFSEEHLNIVDT